MRSTLCQSVICLISLLVSCTAMCELPLMPMPQSVQLQAGKLQLSRALNVSIEGFSGQRTQFQLDKLAMHFTRITGKKTSWFVADEKPAHLTIVVESKEQTLLVPQFGDDERYQLNISGSGIVIRAHSVFGAQHALTTLSQLASRGKNHRVVFPHANIIDSPRFVWRGLLLDSVRHFISVETVKRQLDGMASAKLNVLHWHLTDDQGWRIESQAFPELTERASDGQFYSQQQVKDVVHYAALLGIRVVPEFGMPGHASAIAVAYPELITEQRTYTMQRHWGVFKPLLNIADPKVYDFIDKLFAQMTALFPDRYLHIGGDEVDPQQWLESKDIQKLMAEQELSNGQELQSYFNARLQRIVNKYDRIMMGWDEILHPNLPKNVVVQSWRGHDSLYNAAKSGYKGALSTGFYIDQPQYTHYHYRNDPQKALQKVNLSQPQKLRQAFQIKRLKGSDVKGELLTFGQQVLIKLNNNHHRVARLENSKDDVSARLVVTMDSWMGPLKFEFDLEHSGGWVLIGNSRYPVEFTSSEHLQSVSFSPSLTKAQEALILGAEATIWSEMVTEDNIDLRIWPRTYAIAERLWSSKSLINTQSMYARLEKMDIYAHRVVRLVHQTQQQQGFNRLISKDLSEKERIATIELLNTMAQMVEPSHYYTRHHIKYLKSEYHQQAPLNSFVDFLTVESAVVRALGNSVQQYINGDDTQLLVIAERLVHWQQVLQENNHLLAKSPLLHDEVKTVGKLLGFVELGRKVLFGCQNHTEQTISQYDLLNLQKLKDETVIAAIYPLRDLYLACK